MIFRTLLRYASKSTKKMALSRFEYVKDFELDDRLLPNSWIVVRVDGKGFSKFTDAHKFEKPNDVPGLNLMSFAAATVMKEFNEIVLAFGQSDEYSFVFHKSTQLYNRRAAKILSNVNSLFTASYVMNWSRFQPNGRRLLYPPCFDARIVLYPTDGNLRDYLSWRQADVHINNLYNTVFWCLVLRKGLSNAEAEERLRGTVSGDKNEILFSEFGINYNNLEPMFRKGTTLLRKNVRLQEGGKERKKLLMVPYYADLIKDAFWEEHFELLEKKPVQTISLNELPELVAAQLEIFKSNKS